MVCIYVCVINISTYEKKKQLYLFICKIHLNGTLCTSYTVRTDRDVAELLQF